MFGGSSFKKKGDIGLFILHISNFSIQYQTVKVTNFILVRLKINCQDNFNLSNSVLKNSLDNLKSSEV